MVHYQFESTKTCLTSWSNISQICPTKTNEPSLSCISSVRFNLMGRFKEKTYSMALTFEAKNVKFAREKNFLLVSLVEII